MGRLLWGDRPAKAQRSNRPVGDAHRHPLQSKEVSLPGLHPMWTHSSQSYVPPLRRMFPSLCPLRKARLSSFYLLVRLNFGLVVSGGPGSASRSCPNMADSAVAPGVCITHGGAAVPVNISPAVQHAYFGAACHPIGFSSLRPTSCALFPLQTAFRHTCTKHTMVSGSWGASRNPQPLPRQDPCRTR